MGVGKGAKENLRSDSLDSDFGVHYLTCTRGSIDVRTIAGRSLTTPR
jgi:hypothetical protein